MRSDARQIPLFPFFAIRINVLNKDQGITMNYDPRLEQFAGAHLAVVRRCATLQELSRVVPEACGTVWNALRSNHIKGAGRHVAVYLDDAINIEIGVELASPLAAPIGEVLPSTIPAGPVVTTTHLGPYQNLMNAHKAIHDWCRANNRQPIRPCWEIYAHWQNDWNHSPEKIRTDVFYLLAT